MIRSRREARGLALPFPLRAARPIVLGVAALLAGPGPGPAPAAAQSGPQPAVRTSMPSHAAPAIRSLALRVHRMEAMAAFYREAFDVTFREVEIGQMRALFGELGPVTLKLVPIRGAPDFDGYPVHQPGLVVPDVEAVIEAARRHGGRLEGEPEQAGGVVVRAAVRDPDGNTLELERTPEGPGEEAGG